MDPERGVILRCSWLRDIPLPFAADTLARVRLGPHSFSVTAVEWTEETFASLAKGPATTRADLTFRSPVFFTANGRRTVTPDQRLILGSYRRRWNEALGEESPYRIEDDVWMATQRAVELHAFDLRTVKRDGGHGHDVSGFVGTVTLRVTADEAKETFGTLLRFARYSGTGARTTYGFGATTVTFPRDHDG
ncbi:CRISPR system precrRNA processing endoribonuclease RAMP protein Cas6 [Microbispora bryophytorum]|uniref:CRISPR system precrRNA processing endoribonuclease RAMP protein Cas6 n=1 Tax=Microbispora bryophytorum TaxID=1460882 RepID=UPI0033DE17CE